MRLYTTIKNERGGSKSTGDDTRIQIDLFYKNKKLGTVGLYSIIDAQGEGYRVIFDEEGRGFNPDKKPLLEVYKKIKGKSLKGEMCKICDGPFSNPHVCI